MSTHASEGQSNPHESSRAARPGASGGAGAGAEGSGHGGSNVPRSDVSTSTGEFTLRTLLPADLDPLRWVIYRSYYEVLLDLYGPSSASQYEVRSLDFMAMYLRRDPAGNFVALTEDGTIAGGLFCFVWGEIGWFGSLAVAPEWQGRGLAQRLTRHAIAYLRERGCRRIGLETWPTAPRTRHLYTKLGFRLGRPTVKLARQPRSTSPVDRHRLPDGWSVEWTGAGQPDALHGALDVVRDVSASLTHPAQSLSGGTDSDAGSPRVEYETEVRVPVASGFAEVAALRSTGGEPVGFALAYIRKPSGALATALDIRLLALSPDAPESALDALLTACDARAASKRLDSVTCDVSLSYSRAASLLRERGFRPIYELVRMEVPAPGIDLGARSTLIECARWAG